MSRRYNKFEQYREKFFRIPKVFITNPIYKKMSNDAKFAYAILQDRQELSIKNGWCDDKGDIYFVYSNAKLMDIWNCSEKTVIKIKRELEKAELLEQKQTGRANHFYLLHPEVTEHDIYQIDQSENIHFDNPEQVSENELKTLEPQENCKNYSSRTVKITVQDSKNYSSELKNLQTNDTDFKETDFKEILERENLVPEIKNLLSKLAAQINKRNETFNDFKEQEIKDIEYFYLKHSNDINLVNRILVEVLKYSSKIEKLGAFMLSTKERLDKKKSTSTKGKSTSNKRSDLLRDNNNSNLIIELTEEERQKRKNKKLNML